MGEGGVRRTLEAREETDLRSVSSAGGNPQQPKQASGPAGSTNPNLARDRLANERTFLAWLRTAIAIVSLGFVVAKFDIFLLEVARLSSDVETPASDTNITVPIGVMLVLSGPVIVVVAAVRYLHTEHALWYGRLDSHRLVRNIIVAIALLSVVAGVGLAVHLLVAWPR